MVYVPYTISETITESHWWMILDNSVPGCLSEAIWGHGGWAPKLRVEPLPHITTTRATQAGSNISSQYQNKWAGRLRRPARPISVCMGYIWTLPAWLLSEAMGPTLSFGVKPPWLQIASDKQPGTELFNWHPKLGSIECHHILLMGWHLEYERTLVSNGSKEFYCLLTLFVT